MVQQEIPGLDADIAVLLFGGSCENETRKDLSRQFFENQEAMFVYTAEFMVLWVERELAERQ